MGDLYHQDELRSLFDKYLRRQCSEEELRQLMSYAEEDGLRPVWEELLLQTEAPVVDETLYQPQLDEVYARLILANKPQPAIRRYWWAAAAAVLLLIAAGTFFWPRNITIAPQTTQQQQQQQPDVQPGTNKASLTLADGSVITLDSTGRQTIQQGASSVSQRGGQLVYNVNGESTTLSYNTLRTPRGGEFRITLPDGTNVWLNAASSLRYPTAFTGKERVVEITGEAYFEVAKNAAMPFRVKVGEKAAIEVLGTSFNVNAYDDEPTIKTTLVQGAVNVRSSGRQMLMAPGQQVELTAQGNLRTVTDASVAQATAWKEGFFSFQKADLLSVLRPLARWYDLEITFEGNNIGFGEYTGDIDKSLTLDQVLKGLAKNRLHYKIENGRKLIILP